MNDEARKRADIREVFISAAKEWDLIADGFKSDGIRAGEFRENANECIRIACLLFN